MIGAGRSVDLFLQNGFFRDGFGGVVIGQGGFGRRGEFQTDLGVRGVVVLGDNAGSRLRGRTLVPALYRISTGLCCCYQVHLTSGGVITWSVHLVG